MITSEEKRKKRWWWVEEAEGRYFSQVLPAFHSPPFSFSFSHHLFPFFTSIHFTFSAISLSLYLSISSLRLFVSQLNASYSRRRRRRLYPAKNPSSQLGLFFSSTNVQLKAHYVSKDKIIQRKFHNDSECFVQKKNYYSHTNVLTLTR